MIYNPPLPIDPLMFNADWTMRLSEGDKEITERATIQDAIISALYE